MSKKREQQHLINIMHVTTNLLIILYIKDSIWKLNSTGCVTMCTKIQWFHWMQHTLHQELAVSIYETKHRISTGCTRMYMPIIGCVNLWTKTHDFHWLHHAMHQDFKTFPLACSKILCTRTNNFLWLHHATHQDLFHNEFGCFLSTTIQKTLDFVILSRKN